MKNIKKYIICVFVVLALCTLTNGANIPATWNSQTAYTTGQIVTLNGVTYQAKWWTQNDLPSSNNGTGEPWTVISGNPAQSSGQQINKPSTTPQLTSLSSLKNQVIVNVTINDNLGNDTGYLEIINHSQINGDSSAYLTNGQSQSFKLSMCAINSLPNLLIANPYNPPAQYASDYLYWGPFSDSGNNNGLFSYYYYPNGIGNGGDQTKYQPIINLGLNGIGYLCDLAKSNTTLNCITTIAEGENVNASCTVTQNSDTGEYNVNITFTPTSSPN